MLFSWLFFWFSHSPPTMTQQQQTLVCLSCLLADVWLIWSALRIMARYFDLFKVNLTWAPLPSAFYYTAELWNQLFITVVYLRLFFWCGNSFQQSSSCQKAPGGGLRQERREGMSCLLLFFFFFFKFQKWTILQVYWNFKSHPDFRRSSKNTYSPQKSFLNSRGKVLTLCWLGDAGVRFLKCVKASLLLLFTTLPPPCEPRGSSELRSSSSSCLKWHSPYVLDRTTVFFGGLFFTSAPPRSSSSSASTVSSSPSMSSSSLEKSESCPSLWQSGCARLRALRKIAWILRGLKGLLPSCLAEVPAAAVLVAFTSLTHAGATFFPRLVPLPMSPSGCFQTLNSHFQIPLRAHRERPELNINQQRLDPWQRLRSVFN